MEEQFPLDYQEFRMRKIVRLITTQQMIQMYKAVYRYNHDSVAAYEAWLITFGIPL